MEENSSNWMTNYQDEVNSAFLYRELSRLEKNEQISTVYLKMAESEEKHAGFWAERLKEVKIIDLPGPDARSKALRLIAATFGIQTILPILIGGEQNASSA